MDIDFPPVVYGAVIALVSVFIGNFFQARRQDAQFRSEDARQMQKLEAEVQAKTIERTSALRKEVYLPLAAACSSVNSMFGGLTAAKEVDLAPLKEFTAAAAKVSVVGETTTTVLANELSAEIGLAAMQLMTVSLPARLAKEQASFHHQLRLKSEGHAHIAQIEIDKFLRSCAVNDAQFAALMRNLEGHDKLAQEQWKLETEQLTQHTIESIAYIRILATKMPEIGERLSALSIAVRSELGLETGPEYIESLRLQRDRGMQALEEQAQHFERMMGE